MLDIENNISDIIKGIQNKDKITKYCKNYLNIISDTNFDYVEVIDFNSFLYLLLLVKIFIYFDFYAIIF
jgi:hypothetical protein